MKVTREEKFKPITIVLETKEEADTMWHCLNRALGDAYTVEYNFKPREKFQMYDKFDAFYGKPK